MKTKNGFVSNSSSSSFVCIGAEVKDWSELYKKLNLTLPNFNADNFDYREKIESNSELQKILEDLGLEVEYDWDRCISYLGFTFGRFDDCDPCEFEFSFEAMNKVWDSFLKLGFNDKDIKFIGTTITC